MSGPCKNTDVEEALDLLSAEVREEIQRIRNEGAKAMTKGDYPTAMSVIEFAGKLETFAGNVDKLVQEWNSISDQQEAEPEPVWDIVSKIFTGKASRGTITTHEVFFIPLRHDFQKVLRPAPAVHRIHGLQTNRSVGGSPATGGMDLPQRRKGAKAQRSRRRALVDDWAGG